MDAIDRQIEEINASLLLYRKKLDEYTTVFPVNPCGYEAEPLLSMGSKEDIVIDSLRYYKKFLDIRISSMSQMLIVNQRN